MSVKGGEEKKKGGMCVCGWRRRRGEGKQVCVCMCVSVDVCLL